MTDLRPTPFTKVVLAVACFTLASWSQGTATFRFEPEDGSVIFVFDKDGRHLSTRDADTDETLLTFGYDGDSLLATVTDAFGGSTKPSASTCKVTHTTTRPLDSLCPHHMPTRRAFRVAFGRHDRMRFLGGGN